MRRLGLIAVFLGVLALPAEARAQAKKGDVEMLIFGNLAASVGGGAPADMNAFVFFNIGTFLTDRLELGGGPQMTVSSPSGQDTTVSVGANAFVRLYFSPKNPKVSPYVAGEVNFPSFSSPGGGVTALDLMALQGAVGVKVYVSEKAALDFKAAVGVTPKHASRIQLGSTVGLTFVF